MKKFLVLVLLLSFSLPAYAAGEETAYERVMRTGVLRCGNYPWPPYSVLDPNTEEMTGLIPDIMNIVGKMLDLKVEFVQMSALGMQVEELKKGLYDAHCTDSYYVFSAMKYSDYSSPYLYAPFYAYKKSDDARYKKLSDLDNENVTFVGLDGDISVTLVHFKFPKAKIKTLPANSDAAAITMDVATGKADVAIIDPGLVGEFNKTNPPGLTIVEPGSPVAVYPIGFSVNKGETGLLNMLNSAVSALTNTDTVTPLVKKYGLHNTAIYPVAKPYEVQK